MGGSGTGARLAALLFAWLVGLAPQLRERELMPARRVGSAGDYRTGRGRPARAAPGLRR